MKIAFYINAIHHGGAERVMVNLANKLSENNDCMLITSFIDEWEYPLFPAVKRVDLGLKKNSSFFKRNFGLVKQLRSVIKKEKPDVVISFMAEPNFRNIFACMGLKVRKIISIRNDPRKEYPNRIMKRMAKILYTFSDGIVFQTEDAKKWFSQSIQAKSKIIYNPVDEVFFSTAAEKFPKDIITTGRLTKQKNHMLLLDAFSKIAEKTTANLIIYGDGELKDELENRTKDLNLSGRVFLPGATQDVPGVLKTAKVFVLSSDYEGLPNSLMEALAMGVACISTDCPCGGPKSLMDNRYLVPVNDADKLAEMMLHVLTDTEYYQENRRASQKSAELFRPEIIYRSWRDYIWEIVGK